MWGENYDRYQMFILEDDGNPNHPKEKIAIDIAQPLKKWIEDKKGEKQSD